jgi:two-component system OmpR family sensor kinase
MKPFRTALMRLTFLYVAILMSLALACSIWLYTVAGREVKTVLLNTQLSRQPIAGAVDNASANASQQRLLQDLVFFNLFILGAGTLASYALARRTLKPIQESYLAQGQFASDASHELRTPLTALKTELQLAQRKAGTLQPAEYKAVLGSSLEEVERLTSLASRLLRLTNPRDTTKTEASSLLKALATASQQLHKSLAGKHVHISTPTNDHALAMNHDDLVELFTIILDNAIKYSPTHETITVTSVMHHRRIRIVFEDSGPGIDPVDLPHIFERFYRGNNKPTTLHQPSYGLGLAVARKLAQSVGGEIEARNAPVKGARFIVDLPAAISG